MSAIAYTPIDETFPVAGQDNNSQGFRDNFSYIKTALSVAQTEITSLENSAARTNTDNDFNGQLIENAKFNKLYGELAAQGSVPVSPGSGAVTLDTTTGVYHTMTVTEPLTLTFSQWPASGKEARIRVDMKSDGVARNVSFATSGGGAIKKDFSTPFALSASASTNSVFEAWTVNGGSTVYIKHIGNFS